MADFPYKLVDVHIYSEGKCMKCLAGVEVGYRIYKNLQTGETFTGDFRSACNCNEDTDPYRAGARPYQSWDKQAERWLYPFWSVDKKVWLFRDNSGVVYER